MVENSHVMILITIFLFGGIYHPLLVVVLAASYYIYVNF